MKLLHFADLHIGMENYGKIDPTTGLHSRLLDFIKTFNYIVNYAIKEKIELVIFAGDAYKTREPSPTQENAFASGIKKLSDAGIPVVLVVGNHDLPNTAGKMDTLTIYDALKIPQVYVSSKPELLKVKSATGEPVQIATLPWATKSHVLTKDEYMGKSIEEINTLLTEKLVAIVDHLASQIDSKTPAIFVSHTTVSGATYGSEQNVMLGSDIVLPLGNVAKPQFNYVALGHLHKHQILDKDLPVVYAGSPDRVDFGEEKEDKGFMVAEIARGKKTAYEFVVTPTRPFLTIDITVTAQDPDPTETVLKEIKKHDAADKIIRVRITIPQEQSTLVRDKDIRDALQDAHYLAGIQKFIEMPVRRSSKEHAVTTEQSPQIALQKYIAAKQLDPAYGAQLQEYAERLIQEVREGA